jgi:hypothetical protein
MPFAWLSPRQLSHVTTARHFRSLTTPRTRSPATATSWKAFRGRVIGGASAPGVDLLHDNNYVSLRPPPTSPSPRIARTADAYGWHDRVGCRRQRSAAIDAALRAARAETTRRRSSRAHAHRLRGSPGSSDEAHGSPLGVEDARHQAELAG